MTALTDLDTPVVTVDLDIMADNIRRVQALLDRHGIGNRPHIKTHKIPAIGRMQLEAGASGIVCQKIGEVEVFADHGVAPDVLLTYNILGRQKTDRLMAVARRVERLTVVLDNETVARGLSEAGQRHSMDVRFVVECDTGGGRNGVQTPEAAFDLARLAMRLPRMDFQGLMTFPNKDPDTRLFFERALDLFKQAGIPVSIVSGGGTPALQSVERRVERSVLDLQQVLCCPLDVLSNLVSVSGPKQQSAQDQHVQRPLQELDSVGGLVWHSVSRHSTLISVTQGRRSTNRIVRSFNL